VAKDSDRRTGALDADRPGLLAGLFAEENEFDRSSLWRIGTWGLAAVGAVVLAVTSNQWSMGLRRDQVASADLARQAQQMQSLTKESQNETRRLANAVDTLNSDRDRLFSRITVLEQGLDSVTGTIAKQAAMASAVPKPPPSVAPPPATTMPPSPSDGPLQPATPAAQPGQAAAPVVAPVASTATTAEKPRADVTKPDSAPGALPQIASNKPGALAPAVPLTASPVPQPSNQPMGAVKSMMGPPDPAAPKLVEPAKAAAVAPPPAATPAPAPTAAAEVDAAAAPPKDQDKVPADAETNADADGAKIQRTEFAVDLGAANSIGGLRALWRGLLKSNNAELAELRPIIVLREGNTGLGMQLRLAAGPLPNAADAARICASLVESRRACETTVFDGQRLAMGADEQAPNAKPVQAPRSSTYSKRYYPKHSSKKDDAPTPPKESSTSFSSLLGIGKR